MSGRGVQEQILRKCIQFSCSVLCYGLPATGKTHLLKQLLRSKTHAWINCFECFTPKLLFDRIYQQLDIEAKSTETIDGFYQVMQQQPHQIIVFDHAEKLVDLKLLPAFLKLPQLIPVTILFVSHLTWDDLSNGCDMEPIMIYFDPYTKQDIIDIVSQDSKDALYPEFAEMLYHVFHKPCRDLNEFRHLTHLLFPKFLEPVDQGKVSRKEISKLFGLMQPHIKDALHSLYLRDVSYSEFCGNSAIKTHFFDLPFYCKYLVVSSFLASFNPPKFDARFFVRSNAATIKGQKGRWRQQLLGPKAFPMERLLAIFYSILNDSMDPGLSIETQLATLVSLRLLTKTSLDLDSPRFKCNASFEYCKTISKTIRFDLVGHLYDFVDV